MKNDNIIECANCGRKIVIGQEYVMSKTTGDKEFCCTECMKTFIEEDADLLDEVLDDWAEEKAEYYENEAKDPYDRYGVRESDFA